MNNSLHKLTLFYMLSPERPFYISQCKTKAKTLEIQALNLVTRMQSPIYAFTHFC